MRELIENTKMASTTTVWLIALAVVLVCSEFGTEASRSDVLTEISALVEEEEHPEIPGVFKGVDLLNCRGDSVQYFLRQQRAPATQYFMSGYVAVMILEAFKYGKAPKPSKKIIGDIVQMYGTLHNNNLPYNNSLIVFFPQSYDEEHQFWISQDPGLANGLQSMGLTPELAAKYVYGDGYLPYDLAGSFTQESLERYVKMPPDFDSSGVHISLGALLHVLRSDYPESWKKWNEDNRNFTSAIDAVKRYAYRPFSDDPSANTNDPRIYYMIRKFLDQAKEEERDLILLNTWVQDLEEQRTEYKKGAAMGWGVNNVDIGVVANFFAGLISSVTFELLDPQVVNEDEELNTLIDSSGDVVVFLLETNFEKRIDITALYYPSQMQNYWFIARGLMLMENARSIGKLNVPAFERYYHKLARVMRDEVTSRILNLRKFGDEGHIFYDDFLGNADVSPSGEPIERHEDRIFTTSMAASSLLYTWTVHDDTNGLRWIDDTPDDVKEAVQGCAQWLEDNILTGEYKTDNSFFSWDSMFDALPYWYPANVFEHLNGTKIEGFTYIPPSFHTIGIRGYVEPDVYEEMLKVQQFGVKRPDTFEGFNNVTGSLLFFSGPAFTYAGAMMALSMAEQVE